MTDIVGREFNFDVEGSLDLVWRALTTDDGLATWYVADATVDPTPGGSLEVDWGTGPFGLGSFEVVNEPTHLKLVYGEPEVGVEEWLLTHDGGVTHVRLIHSLPVEEGATWDDQYGDIVRGWSLFHGTLIWVAAKRRELGRRSDVRIGSIGSGGWDGVLSELGLNKTPATGSTIQLLDGDVDVLVSVDGLSLLLGSGDQATLLVDIEGDSLYTLAATYGTQTRELSVVHNYLVTVAESLCAAVGN